MECEACGHKNVDGARFCANCGITIVVASDENDPMIGQVVGGRYRITGIIGEGGMGIVYEGEQQMGSTVRKVAVKTLHAELSRDPSVTARFHRECGTVAQLEHPNTIKVYDFGATPDGTLYIAMEYLAGKPLDQVIETEGALHPDRVVKLLQQMSGSLTEAHGQGIIHRDLKPENVILTERAGTRDVVKLLDFGIAARTESADAEKEAKLTQQGMVLGTPPYMSPEQFTGKALDKRSDIYSLAVMAYEMLTASLPFEANTPWEWATEHMTAQPRPFETMAVSANIPPGMRAAILKALSKDREERFATVEEFVEALSAQQSGQATAAAEVASGTAVMEAAPDFGAAPAGPAPTAAMPVQASSPKTAAIPHATSPAKTSTSSKRPIGVIAGLGGAAVLLLGGIGIALSGGNDDSADVALVLSTASAIAPATVAPVEPTAPDEKAEPDEDEPEAASVPAPAPRAKSPTKSGGASKPKETAKSGGKPKAEKDTKKEDPAKAGGTACASCISKANSGAIVGAAQQYRQCSDPAKKKSCSGRARRRAGQAAKAAVKSGNCAKAGKILVAANSMGAGSPRLTSTVKGCK